jgi:hypothetical protein
VATKPLLPPPAAWAGAAMARATASDATTGKNNLCIIVLPAVLSALNFA